MNYLASIRARLNERSTYMFWIGSIGTVAAFPEPWSYIGGAILFVAGLVPDGPVKSGGDA